MELLMAIVWIGGCCATVVYSDADLRDDGALQLAALPLDFKLVPIYLDICRSKLNYLEEQEQNQTKHNTQQRYILYLDHAAFRDPRSVRREGRLPKLARRHLPIPQWSPSLPIPGILHLLHARVQHSSRGE